MRALFVSTLSSPDLTANVKVGLPSIRYKLCYLSWEMIDVPEADSQSSSSDTRDWDDLVVTELPAAHPTLIIVSGPAGSGKTTLAHRLAAMIGCPALCRDELKEGMVAATPGFVPGPLDPLTLRTYDLFFAAIRLFLSFGVTHVAEAAFQHANWVRGLEQLKSLAELRILRCQLAPSLAQARAEARLGEQPTRAAHDDAGHFHTERSFEPIRLDAPTLDVNTASGYNPDLQAIGAFVRSQ
jgi:predicted kinase